MDNPTVEFEQVDPLHWQVVKDQGDLASVIKRGFTIPEDVDPVRILMDISLRDYLGNNHDVDRHYREE